MPGNEIAIVSPFLDCLAPEHEHCKEREPGNETEVIANKDATIIRARVGKPSPTLSKNAKCKVGVCVCLSEIYSCWANGGTLLLVCDSVAHRVPHDYVDVVIKRPINVLRGVEVEEVTEMMVEIHSYGMCKQCLTHRAYATIHSVHKVSNKVPGCLPV